jgi:hypothetical protein
MTAAADAAHEFWMKIGTWVHDERARYLKALVANALGKSADGLVHADAALAIIAANGEQPVDWAFLTLARSRSLHLLATRPTAPPRWQPPTPPRPPGTTRA